MAEFVKDKDVLISRQAAIDTILGQPPEPHYPSWYAEQIKELPAAEPKRGKWTTFDSYPYIRCSVCKEPHPAVDLRDYTFNFCPNCGARMEEPE